MFSDCWAVKDFYNKGAHEVTENQQEAAAMAVKAGTDLNCGDSYPALVEAVINGQITEDELSVSLERLIVARLRLGLFAPQGAVKYENILYDIVDSETHRLLALETARKSLVLLKNENNLLPLSKDVKKVAVIGPNANVLQHGGGGSSYVNPMYKISPLQGIKNMVGERLKNGLK